MRGTTADIEKAPPGYQEKHAQRQVLDYALLRHWLAYHDFDSRRNARGFLDTVLCREGRLVFMEVKIVKNGKRTRLRPEQKEWIAALKTVPGIEVYVVYLPDDWHVVERILA